MTIDQQIDRVPGLRTALNARGTETASRLALDCAWQNYGLAVKFVNRLGHNYRAITLEFEDLVMEAIIGIAQAVARFDPAISAFSSYAYFWVRDRVIKAISRGPIVPHPVYLNELCGNSRRVVSQRTRDLFATRWTLRCDIVTELSEVSAASHVYASTNTIPASSSGSWDRNIDEPENLDRVLEVRDLIRRALDQVELTTQEREILRLRYVEDLTLKEIGDRMVSRTTRYHLTRERVRQIEAGAMHKLRRWCVRNGVDRKSLQASTIAQPLNPSI